MNLQTIINQFKTEGSIKSHNAFGEGLINDTYLIETEEQNKPNYILQRINHNIFKDVPGLTKNKVLTSQHIFNKLKDDKITDIHKRVLQFVQTKDDLYYYIDDKGGYWNLSVFIENAVTYNYVSNTKIAYEGGKAIGLFQKQLADMPSDEIIDTIPNFHNTAMRIKDFQSSLKKDVANRAANVKDLIKSVEMYQDKILQIADLIESGEIPKRIVHNDTKISNVLFDSNDNFLCMIDLDTIMRGSVLHDFGDALRSGTNTGAEDDKDLDKVNMDISLFKGYAEGYAEESKSFLTKIEIDHLAFAGQLITFEQFIRFFMDYLDGDIYYKTQYAEHNLVRSKAQFKLFSSMNEQYDEMCNIIDKLF